eukprot:TRINITY_DN8392_c0_g4_i4.p1 TRINITY_DN8392_c0_g4~~TRINITY_DN8392_c0_g4_i4.p1  ORF type:complete len:126 (+),score=27.75 TRINITY_DN8392_c0_g4_i4:300-677(+)
MYICPHQTGLLYTSGPIAGPIFCSSVPPLNSVHPYPGTVGEFTTNYLQDFTSPTCDLLTLFVGSTPSEWNVTDINPTFSTQNFLHEATFHEFLVFSYVGIPQPSDPTLCTNSYCFIDQGEERQNK